MINVVHDLALRQTQLAAADQPAAVERSRSERLIVRVTDTLASAPLGADASLLFTLKEKGKRNSDPLVQVTLTIADLKGNTLDAYLEDFDAITTGVNTLLGVSDLEENTITSKQCEGCFSYRASDEDEWQDGDPFEVLLINTVRNEEDDTPLHEDTPETWLNARAVRYLPAVVGLTGGGATKLDGMVTAGVDVPIIVQLVISGVPALYQLTAGTTAESSPGIIRPDDYASSTNEKIWTQLT